MKNEKVLNTIEEAIEDFRQGKIVIVVDDEDRENEGDFIIAAEKVTPEIVNFMLKNGRGVLCAPLSEERCAQLELNMMEPNNTSLLGTPFTVTVDLLGEGCTTGVSIHDRAATLRALADPKTKPSDLGRPGHINPLRARQKGVLRRPGHTEAAVDLARLAGLQPAGALIEIMNEDGSMARLPQLLEVAEKYGLKIDPDALIEDITVGMQQRTEILKMLYRDNEILIFDEPTAVLTPQEIDELMQIMKNLAAEGKSILFISHKLNEIMAVADRCTVLRKGKYIGTVETKNTTMEQLSSMMVGRDVSFHVEKKPAQPGEVVLDVSHMTVASKMHKNNAVKDVSLQVRRGEIVCLAGIDGNGQTEFVYGLTGLEPVVSGKITLNGQDITKMPIRKRNIMGMSHIPEDRHKHGLVLDYSLEDNLVLERYFEPEFTDKAGFLRRDNIRKYAEKLIEQYDVRSGQGPVTIARSMSGGNQQKAIVAREIDRDPELLVAVQPTRGLDVGAIEYIHKQLVAQRDAGKAVLLVSLELDEVMDVPDRILVMYEGEIVGELDPKKTTQEELGLYMAGAKRDEVTA